jgi:DNA sulfur modification protein DndD
VVAGLQADVREQEMLEASLSDGRREEDALRSDLKALLGTGWRAVARSRLQEALERVQSINSRFQQHESDISTARTRVAVLEDRLRGGDCPTCNQPLPPPSAETSADLEQAKADLARLLEASGGGVLDLHQERRIAALVDTRTIDEYRSKHRRLGEIQVLQYERKQALAAISDRLRGHRAADIRALAQQEKEIDVAIRGIRHARETVEKQAKDVYVEQQRLARQLDKLPGARPEVKFEAAFFRYADDLLDKTIDAYRERVRAQVERDAQDMFLQLIHDPTGYGGLRIGSDYNIDLLDTRSEARKTSEGGKQLLALSLIGALKKAAVRGGPVVLDSPLGRLDLKHRANVLGTWIPALGGQAILLVQSGELTKADASTLLGSSVGHAYEILRPSGDPEHVVIEKV